MSRPLGGPIGRALWRAGGLVLLGTLIGAAVITWRIWDTGQRDDRQPADAIVVMGAAQYDGRPSPVFAARLDHAIELFRSDVAPVLVVTGGKQPGDRTTEAATARAYAIEHGVPPEAILLEDASRSTEASIAAVASLLAANDRRTAVFVSDRTHLLRVLWMAGEAGLTAHGSPTTTSPLEGDVAATVDALVHEVAGIAAYGLSRLTAQVAAAIGST